MMNSYSPPHIRGNTGEDPGNDEFLPTSNTQFPRVHGEYNLQPHRYIRHCPPARIVAIKRTHHVGNNQHSSLNTLQDLLHTIPCVSSHSIHVTIYFPHTIACFRIFRFSNFRIHNFRIFKCSIFESSDFRIFRFSIFGFQISECVQSQAIRFLFPPLPLRFSTNSGNKQKKKEC